MLNDVQGPASKDIQNLFSSVAHGYDRANSVMTLGLDQFWRRQLVRWSGAKPGQSVLDCATGTGDLAFAFQRAVGSGAVIGTDFCEAMLEKAPDKARRLNLKVQFQIADVTKLPFADASFDICSIAYGIRNVENPLKALSEMARVVKPGGVVMVLETGEAKAASFSKVLELYFHHVIPRLGGWVTGQRWAYEYLNRSSQKFPGGPAFLEWMKSTGSFSHVEYRSLLGGASFIYKGVRSVEPVRKVSK